MTIPTKTPRCYGNATAYITDRAMFGDITDLLDALIDDKCIVDSSSVGSPLDVMIVISSNETANKIMIHTISLKKDKVTGNFLQEVGGITADFHSNGLMVLENVHFNILTSCVNCKNILCNFIKTGEVPEAWKGAE